ncbi:hypothetical protein [Bradyrhizobium sp. OAE829]|uniref:hypothetical protein n=1 Tax=Bradyrhizobium sp. OAE829 TaxID=2663807 RepID=UPI00178ABC26
MSDDFERLFGRHHLAAVLLEDESQQTGSNIPPQFVALAKDPVRAMRQQRRAYQHRRQYFR